MSESKNLQSLLLINEEHFDFGTTLHTDSVEGLLDGHGYVKLIDFHPRIIPRGYSPDMYMIVRAARTSTGKGIKDPITDAILTKYLFDHAHTSPIEQPGVILAFKIPQVIGVHFLRHRTAKPNAFSGRYSEVGEDMGLYNPLVSTTGIRMQSDLNKQSSSNNQEWSEEQKTQIVKVMTQLNEHQAATFKLYQELLGIGVAREISRFWLPQSQYQILFIQFDLSNLIKMLFLRDDLHAQLETQVYAQAITKLCEPIFPIIFGAYKNKKAGMSLTGDEVEAFKQGTKLNTKSKSEQTAYEKKVKRLKS